MIVHSGGKSLHAWFAVANADETQINRFMRYAELLGADPAGRVKSQYFRMPHGTRDNGKRQPVVYLDLATLENNGKK
jgi:hypothetical protein